MWNTLNSENWHINGWRRESQSVRVQKIVSYSSLRRSFSAYANWKMVIPIEVTQFTTSERKISLSYLAAVKNNPRTLKKKYICVIKTNITKKTFALQRPAKHLSMSINVCIIMATVCWSMCLNEKERHENWYQAVS